MFNEDLDAKNQVDVIMEDIQDMRYRLDELDTMPGGHNFPERKQLLKSIEKMEKKLKWLKTCQ